MHDMIRYYSMSSLLVGRAAFCGRRLLLCVGYIIVIINIVIIIERVFCACVHPDFYYHLLLDAYIQTTLEGCCRGSCGLLRVVALRGVFVCARGYLDVCAVFQARVW